jgi:hypothetical protein
MTGAFCKSAIRNMKFPTTARSEERVILTGKKAGELGGLVDV